MVEEAKDVALQAAEKVKSQATIELEQDKVRVRNELQSQVSSLVMQGVSAVLSKEVDGKTHKTMLNKLSQTL